ncbi:MAG: hypothetical protein IKS94_03620 [Prevotella sp.]|nr:hypothetical protein [Prevotella sp.]
MGRKISLFADYHGKENSVTNYCGLMFKLVYEESPVLFNQLLDICFDGEIKTPVVGPIFEQQKKNKNSIPDLEITQSSFQILFETKTSDWYHKDQLDNHIKGFSSNEGCKILVLLCNFEDKNQNSERNQFKDILKEKGIFMAELTFEDAIIGLNKVCNSSILQNYLSEFEDFLNRNNLLPIWKYTLDVVNCVGTKDEIINGSVYMCPDTGGQYSHKRAMYFGAYWNKKVNFIYKIDAIINVEKGYADQIIKWKNSESLQEKDLKSRAKKAIQMYRKDEIERNGLLVFLLSEKREISFEKDSQGGLYGSKIYFNVKSNNIEDLVKELNENKWSALK